MYYCQVIKSFQSLPVGAKVELDKETYKRRLKNNEVVLVAEIKDKEIDESMLEDEEIHSDNVNQYTATEDENENRILKKK